MIFVGIDDTDTLNTPGTNQLARALVRRVEDAYECIRIVRHQLLYDPRVPYTSKNGSASITLRPRNNANVADLLRELRASMLDWFKPGSDPGLCIVENIPHEVIQFGRKCQQELVNQAEARALASALEIYLEGLGGTEGGVIGALAAVGLIAEGNDGRVVQHGTWPDDLSGAQPVTALRERGIDVRELDSNRLVSVGTVDVGKHLRPNLRQGKVVVFVSRLPQAPGAADDWQAVRLT